MGDKQAIDAGVVPRAQPSCAGLADEDDGTFDQWVVRYRPDVSRLVRRIMGWADSEVEDVVQEVFVRAYLAKGRFRGDGSVWTWLMTITINACRSSRRRKIFRLEQFRRWIRHQPQASTQGTPVEDVAEKVRDAMSRLPGRDREVVVLYYLQELPVSEIAGILKISQGAVNVRLHRARGKLKETLADLKDVP